MQNKPFLFAQIKELASLLRKNVQPLHKRWFLHIVRSCPQFGRIRHQKQRTFNFKLLTMMYAVAHTVIGEDIRSQIPVVLLEMVEVTLAANTRASCRCMGYLAAEFLSHALGTECENYQQSPLSPSLYFPHNLVIVTMIDYLIAVASQCLGNPQTAVSLAVPARTCEQAVADGSPLTWSEQIARASLTSWINRYERTAVACSLFTRSRYETCHHERHSLH